MNCLDDLCLNLDCAITQLIEEVERGLGLKGTEGYRIMGCYTCTGYNINCPAYINGEIK